MSFSQSSIVMSALEPSLDIFSKYISGLLSDKMPFRLYCQKDQKKTLEKKRLTRGPYRKYTPQEKRDIIQQILEGASLKSIADQTEIPKRNLIRWKHQFLQSKASFQLIGSASEESEQSCDSKLLACRKHASETKSSLSQLSLKTHKNLA